MKIGDKVYSIKFRENEIATIYRTDFRKVSEVDLDTGEVKNSIRSSYKAIYEDGHKLAFYGASVNKTIFKIKDKTNQMSIFD